MQKTKLLLAAVLTVVMLFSFISPAAASTVSNTGVMVNNRLISGDTSPAYLNGTLLVTVKELINSFGGTFTYDSNSMTGTIRKDENEIVFRLDDSVVKFNGKYIQAPAPMKAINNRFMIPAQFTAGKLGAEVYMNTSRNILMIFQPLDGKIIYQVMPGDSLWAISQLFGTSINMIKQLNNLTSDTIYIGQKLIIKNYTPFNAGLPAQTTSNATLRSGAGFDYSPVSYLAAVTNITVAGKNGDWYKVASPKGNGYIYYSIVAVKQDITDSSTGSAYFNSNISIDTSMDYVTYTKYTAQKGDTLWSISEKQGIPFNELALANNMTDSTILYVGQVLTVPVHNIPLKTTLGDGYGEILDWFKEAQYVFPIGKVGRFIDLETGKSFMAQRTMGASHSDTETLTPQDTQTMKEIFGGSWAWNKRPFILEVDGRRIAISIAGKPHAGIDGTPFLQNVDNRSDNWGYGPNYDRISGNGMDGHFDVYFLNCLRHNDNNLDPQHQYRVLVAGGLR